MSHRGGGTRVQGESTDHQWPIICPLQRERQPPCLICKSVFASNTVYGDEVRNTTQQHVTVHIVMMTYYCAKMSTPPVSTPYRRYNDGQWLTYVTEATQSGNHKQYCSTHNIEYKTFKRKYAEYKQADNKENWSTKSKRRYRHRVFTDSTEKQAHQMLNGKSSMMIHRYVLTEVI